MRRVDLGEPEGCLARPQASLEACDEGLQELAPPRGECPPELLGAFTVRMAAHGRAVRSDLMLGDREYALWQLARAHTTDDPVLRQLAARLFACLDEGGG